MPELFPSSLTTPTVAPEATQNRQVTFGKSWRFDFDTGEFVLTPTGKVAESLDIEAWAEWCKKALFTARYRFMIYSRNYGNEFEDLIGRGLNRAAKESEIRRIATECLMADPRTAKVGNFTFEWLQDGVIFSCEVSNVRGESATVESVVNV